MTSQYVGAAKLSSSANYWTDLFPWLAGLPVAGRRAHAILESGSDIDESPEVEDFLNFIARELVELRSGVTVGKLVPGLATDLLLAELNVGTRMTNALSDRRCDTLSDISAVSVADLLNWRNVGVGSVQDLVSRLLIAAVREHQTNVNLQNDASLGWLRQIASDLRDLAKWNFLVGRPHSSLLQRDPSMAEPSAVEHARHRLAQVTASDVFESAPESAADLIGAALANLDPREIQLLRDRNFSDSPMTLDALGVAFGITRERVRQIEVRAFLGLREDSSAGLLAGLSDAIREHIGTISSLGGLLSSLPAMRETVDQANQPVWRVLDRLDDSYEIRDRWCGIPSVGAQVDRTHTQLRELATDTGYTTVSRLIESDEGVRRLSEQEQADWLSYCGFVELEGYLLPRSAGIADRAAVVLEAEGHPMSGAEIVARLDIERSIRSAKNALSLDPRFVRVNRDAWGLAQWGLSQYKSIRDLIGVEVDAKGGQISLSDLVDTLTTRYSVSASSVVIYGNSHPYRMENGQVRRLTSEDMDLSGRSVWQTPRLHRGDGCWILRTRITSDHLRGSGCPLPSALARALGIERATSKMFATTDGEQLVSWKSSQPTLGSIRRLITQFSPDEDIFLIFSDDASFHVEPRKPAVNILDEILATAGLSADSQGSPLGKLAVSIGLRADVGVAGLISALRGRRDDDLAEMLEGI
ncbi:hypothetical protein E3O53_07885 [Cryobacterium sp. TMT2-18-3]|uniref:sigma factor-like helix-turn-helix DNA-binding protein n=1 Tax=unclassified Cryobacterium TaxID=2649013 RepID=UPI00106BFE47|nr:MULTISPECIES: sigma factor-like helix-turn-helix DNA-binding protein [unclassified Cryobacterium]TFC26433.1 hypothetical protein E3O22_12425 [Cryobacterium sp. TMT2-18-2]TFC64389.1 hypothetical protein E3O53_07885 [Cryobacterium sp. TMT2-18-3]